VVEHWEMPSVQSPVLLKKEKGKKYNFHMQTREVEMCRVQWSSSMESVTKGLKYTIIYKNQDFHAGLGCHFMTNFKNF
jgi:hypothetical protein